ncbi:hypothetical protein RZS28_19820 (plasmid) [Methylocapsa polymorpha]|uniref:Phosphohydrolase n=1 Tax=Methylocapsa polymorpha TaxID=3080828 RepID=A0ABZ0HZC5_9HYPH|nr:hypothetical protein [Methylocapsa sp. RX1]WOJ91695.1 hypothetical protein RZS28_19820 [Methylocapsa sp. RX1]
MNLPDFTKFEPLNRLKDQMGIPRDQYGAFPEAPNKPRAWVLLNSGRQLDLLEPHPDAWSHEDLAIGLSRTYRWAGYSKWDLPLSVAQHSLAVLALREALGPLTAREALREILHDATEALWGFDLLGPLKPHLAPHFERLDRRLQDAVDQRYQLPAWTDDSYAQHKHADRLAAASEAYNVVGWTRDELRDSLGITLAPLDVDPLPSPPGTKPWEPWPPKLAQTLFLQRLTALLARADRDSALTGLAQAFTRLPEKLKRRFSRPPTGNSLKDVLVFVEADDGSQSLEGVVVDGQRDEDGAFDLDAEFTVFTTDDKPGGELIRCSGWMCHVEIL